MNLAKYFLRGLLILLPVVVTGYVVYWVFNTLSGVLQLLGRLLPIDVPGALTSALGMAVAVVLITVIGMLASNFVGQRVVRLMQRTIERVPLVKLLYNSVRDLLGAFVGDKKSFDKPVMVSLGDRDGAKVVGFVTRDSLAFLGIDGHIAVYLPQSYNFAGNLLVVPSERVEPLSAPSSDVMTFLVSGGVSGNNTDEEP